MKMFGKSAVTFVIALLCALPVSAATEELKRQNNDGVRLLAAKMYGPAVIQFNRALKTDPSYARARSNLAEALVCWGEEEASSPNKAVRYYYQALIVDPDFAKAVDALNTILREDRKNPNDFKTRVDMGKSYAAQGKFGPAIVNFRRALKLQDDATVSLELKKAESAYAEDSQERSDMRERILASEGIYKLRCVNAPPSSGVEYGKPPTLDFNPVDGILGPPICHPMPIVMTFGESGDSPKPDGWKYKPDLLPQKNGLILVFIPNCVPIPGIGFHTYHGAFGRMEATEHNLQLIKEEINSDRLLP